MALTAVLSRDGGYVSGDGGIGSRNAEASMVATVVTAAVAMVAMVAVHHHRLVEFPSSITAPFYDSTF